MVSQRQIAEPDGTDYPRLLYLTDRNLVPVLFPFTFSQTGELDCILPPRPCIITVIITDGMETGFPFIPTFYPPRQDRDRTGRERRRQEPHYLPHPTSMPLPVGTDSVLCGGGTQAGTDLLIIPAQFLPTPPIPSQTDRQTDFLLSEGQTGG